MLTDIAQGLVEQTKVCLEVLVRSLIKILKSGIPAVASRLPIRDLTPSRQRGGHGAGESFDEDDEPSPTPKPLGFTSSSGVGSAPTGTLPNNFPSTGRTFDRFARPPTIQTQEAPKLEETSEVPTASKRRFTDEKNRRKTTDIGDDEIAYKSYKNFNKISDRFFFSEETEDPKGMVEVLSAETRDSEIEKSKAKEKQQKLREERQRQAQIEIEEERLRKEEMEREIANMMSNPPLLELGSDASSLSSSRRSSLSSLSSTSPSSFSESEDHTNYSGTRNILFPRIFSACFTGDGKLLVATNITSAAQTNSKNRRAYVTQKKKKNTQQ